MCVWKDRGRVRRRVRRRRNGIHIVSVPTVRAAVLAAAEGCTPRTFFTCVDATNDVREGSIMRKSVARVGERERQRHFNHFKEGKSRKCGF